MDVAAMKSLGRDRFAGCLIGWLCLLAAAGGRLCGADRPEVWLWPGEAPGSEGKAGREHVRVTDSGEHVVSKVHRPSLTPFVPVRGAVERTAVLVIPGGGHRELWMDHEGYLPAEALRQRGIAAFVLKYRLARETNSTYQIAVHALDDTRRAVRLIRSRATEWGVNPRRIGALGFSAGGELVWLASDRFDAGNAAALDPVERQGSRPDFLGFIYPGRAGDIRPGTNSPPAFLAGAYDDRQDIAEGLADVYLRFKRAGIPAELHIYGSGGHGFGVRPKNARPVGQWLARFEEWMVDRGYHVRE